MRRPIFIVLATCVAMAVAVVIADLNAPGFIEIRHGSVGFEPQADDLELLPAAPGCEEPLSDSDRPCPRRYAFPTDPGTLIAWTSVRNEGPVPVTLRGISQRWLDQFLDVDPLGKPLAGLDGGDPRHGISELRGAPHSSLLC